LPAAMVHDREVQHCDGKTPAVKPPAHQS
jgi:hypothetical protein